MGAQRRLRADMTGMSGLSRFPWIAVGIDALACRPGILQSAGRVGDGDIGLLRIKEQGHNLQPCCHILRILDGAGRWTRGGSGSHTRSTRLGGAVRSAVQLLRLREHTLNSFHEAFTTKEQLQDISWFHDMSSLGLILYSPI